ncbi:MAG TPA: hypothetical protein PLQ93_11085 [Bacteroidia bacterium]|nr:hypothetical protein [Bacteroidia bacterium]
MANDKVLKRLKEQVRELHAMLEPFGEDSNQPTASDCEKLQKQLCLVQEQLAVFKHQKQTHEVSPSFNLHAHLSEESKTLAVSDPRPPITEAKPEQTEVHKQKPVQHQTEDKLPTAFAVGVNDKFRFINELFAQNPAEYNIAIEQLSALHSWAESELYVNSLKTLYAWKDNQEVVKQFYQTVKRRFE